MSEDVVIIYDTSLCGRPGCDSPAMVVFLYKQGAVYACLDDAKETMDDYIKYMEDV